MLVGSIPPHQERLTFCPGSTSSIWSSYQFSQSPYSQPSQQSQSFQNSSQSYYSQYYQQGFIPLSSPYSAPYSCQLFGMQFIIRLNTIWIDAFRFFLSSNTYFYIIAFNSAKVICPPLPVSLDSCVSWHPEIQKIFLFFQIPLRAVSKIVPEWQASTSNRQQAQGFKLLLMASEIQSSVNCQSVPSGLRKQKTQSIPSYQSPSQSGTWSPCPEY